MKKKMKVLTASVAALGIIGVATAVAVSTCSSQKSHSYVLNSKATSPISDQDSVGLQNDRLASNLNEPTGFATHVHNHKRHEWKHHRRAHHHWAKVSLTPKVLGPTIPYSVNEKAILNITTNKETMGIGITQSGFSFQTGNFGNRPLSTNLNANILQMGLVNNGDNNCNT